MSKFTITIRSLSDLPLAVLIVEYLAKTNKQ